jgi:hypothetical protein
LKLTPILVAIVCAFASESAFAQSAQETERAKGINSALQYGAATASAVYDMIDAGVPAPRTGDRFTDLGNRIHEHYQGSVAVGSLLKAQTDFAGDLATNSAAIPGYGVALAVTGYGIKKSGEWVYGEIVTASERTVRTMLATSWPESRRTYPELNKMKTADVDKTLDGFMIGQEKLKNVLGENSPEYKLVRVAAEDMFKQITVATLQNTVAIKGSQEEIKAELKRQGATLAGFVRDTQERFDGIYAALGQVNNAVIANAKATNDLALAVKNDTLQAQAVARVMAMGWSPEQRLAAARTGALGLNVTQMKSFEAQVNAEIAQRERFQGLVKAADYLGSMRQIGSNLNAPKDVMNVIGAAEIGATAYLQFSSNPMAAAATLSNLASFGRPSAAAKAQAAMYKYLQQQFAQVFSRLDDIEKLQRQTIE